MREPYLLAAGLLTGLAIPASALPQMLAILPQHDISQWDVNQGLQTRTDVKNNLNHDVSVPEFSSQVTQPVEKLQPTFSQKFFPRLFQLSLSELSSQLLPASEASETKVGDNKLANENVSLRKINSQEIPNTVESLFNPSSQPTNQSLTSGNQLYYQRLAALKTGQIYTRTDIERGKLPRDSGRKRQLTYEDWKSLLVLEGKAIAQGQGKNRLSILVGDSLSLWFPTEKLPTGKLWLNQGISGDTSSGIARRLAAFAKTRPDAIYIMAGINDLRKGTSDEVILRNYRRILRSLRQTHPKTQIFVQSILPTDISTISNSRIRHLNQRISEIAQQEGANYLNIHHWFTNADGNLRSDLTTDGLHLSQDGYDVWRFALQQVEFKLSQAIER
ncbi:MULTISPECIES: SGNH/GDSL hydrolase family protein [unclassified Anabaena]|uniref:SGNH/GDSL hydrolase family protein n=1 Tax=unclassified Anabaena TaxID=2619674 RepID=UPI0008305B45|nr:MULTISPECIES: SGNH/GDSL hydrolase family protein [unclassified Anabaena]